MINAVNNLISNAPASVKKQAQGGVDAGQFEALMALLLNNQSMSLALAGASGMDGSMSEGSTDLGALSLSGLDSMPQAANLKMLADLLQGTGKGQEGQISGTQDTNTPVMELLSSLTGQNSEGDGSFNDILQVLSAGNLNNDTLQNFFADNPEDNILLSLLPGNLDTGTAQGPSNTFLNANLKKYLEAMTGNSVMPKDMAGTSIKDSGQGAETVADTKVPEPNMAPVSTSQPQDANSRVLSQPISLSMEGAASISASGSLEKTETAGETEKSDGPSKNQDTVTAVKDFKRQPQDAQYIVQRPELIKLMKDGGGSDNSSKSTSSAFETGTKGTKKVETAAHDASAKAGDRFQDVFQTVSGTKNQGDAMVQPAQQDAGRYVKTSSEDIMNQIYDRIKVVNSKDMQELHISLKPEQLGEVTIKLAMEKGLMTGRILVENSQVKSLVESNLPQIKENLKAQNLDVSGFSVSVGLKQEGQNFNQNFYRPRYSYNRTAVQRTSMEVPVEDSRIVQARSSALNLLV